jgi:hypothetical protein
MEIRPFNPCLQYCISYDNDDNIIRPYSLVALAIAGNKWKCWDKQEFSMRKFLALAVFASSLGSTAYANDQQEVENIGHCLTFAYVRAGLDGEKEIPSDLAAGLAFIKNEYEVRAANIGMDEEARQKAIVLALNEKNVIVQTEGLAALESRYKTLCQNIAETFAHDVGNKPVATDNLSPSR